MRGNEPWAIVVPYVDARAIMKRLDEVARADNWQTRFIPTQNGMLCELSIQVDGSWISKMDGSDETDYEAFKGGISKALVRAAVHWGIGRELYSLPEVFAKFVEKSTPGARWAKIDGREFWWVPNLAKFQAAREAAGAAKPAPGKPAAHTQAPASSGGMSAQAAPTRPAQPPAPPTGPAPVAVSPAPIVENRPGDVLVPFGRSQGKRLADLTDSEIHGLQEFYARVTQPKGRAKIFKVQFDAFLEVKRKAG